MADECPHRRSNRCPRRRPDRRTDRLPLPSHGFRRDQRLKVYGEFVRAFLDVSRTGVALQSLRFSLGDFAEVKDLDRRAVIQERWSDHITTRVVFEESTARLRLIASKPVRREAGTLEIWVTNNVHGAPPFTVGGTFAEGATAAKQGLALVESESFELARTFATTASRDVAGWLLGHGGRTRNAVSRATNRETAPPP